MSGTAVTLRDQGQGMPGSPGTRGLPGPVTVVIAAATLVALGLRLAELAGPNLLGVTQYDDGAYFGSAVRLVHGILPYRDFYLVQPPGITLLMAPAALASKVVGTAWGMAAGRVLTVLASTASVTLTGLLVRHRGLLAVTVACGIMTVYPGSLEAAHTVFVEPWLVLFCLLSAVMLFDGDVLADGWRRLAGGGAALGFAGATEAWAVFPFAVMLALVLTRPGTPARPRRSRAAVFAAGTAAGFCVPVLPFAVLAPRGMYDSLVTSQIGRVTAPTPISYRLRLMTGTGQLRWLSPTAVTVIAIAVAVLITALVLAASLAGHRRPPPLETFAVATAALVVTAFLWYPQFFVHFPAFLAPFLALALALPAARLAAGARASRAGRPAAAGRSQAAARAWVAAGTAVLIIGLAALTQTGSVGKVNLRIRPSYIAAGRRVIPPGACVATDQASILIAANRFSSDVPGCSPMVDGLATDYALSHGRNGDTGAGRVPAVAAAWRDMFSHAQYAWLSGRFSARRIAWTPALRAYFRAHFRPVLRDRRGDVVYVRRS
jgi:alpha-1,2-mannosyltransferase